MCVAISPCPNDTWSFSSLTKFFPGPVDLKVHPLEVLNRLAETTAPFELTKLSVATFGRVASSYVALPAGGSFAIKGGPRLVCKNCKAPSPSHCRLAIPGRGTSAYFAFCLLHGEPKEVVEMPAENVMDAVAQNLCDAGIVIHACWVPDTGLHEIEDLGKSFLQKFGFFLPLGVVVVRRSLCKEVIQSLSRAVKMSIQEIDQNAVPPFVLQNASSWSLQHIREYVSSYVTSESAEMSERAEESLKRFLHLSAQMGLLPKIPEHNLIFREG